MENLFTSVQGIICELFRARKNSVKIDTEQEDIKEWDSLGHLKLFLRLEQYFKIKFSLQEISRFNSVRDIISAIKKKSSRNKP